MGVIDRQTEISGHLNGIFHSDHFGLFSGPFLAKVDAGKIMLFIESLHQSIYVPSIRFVAEKESHFSLSNVTIGNRFHWERKESQTFKGDLVLHLRPEGKICAINEIFLEDYLVSVISSEMNSNAPAEFLKAHAILSRSWVLHALDRKKIPREITVPTEKITEGEMIRWYDRTDHDLFDFCADDHCQRYQGVGAIISTQAEEAARQTHGMAMIFRDEVCDTRYSKCCGGLTETFDTAWEDRQIPYLTTISDAPVSRPPIRAEEEASKWILTAPEAYCRVTDEHLLEKILPNFDRETKNFFRWKVQYRREELEEIVRKKSGVDFGVLKEIIPLLRGPSGRISQLKIVGSQKSMVVGKELEIRRWLSPSHLYSSAFVVKSEANQFIFHGAGWGHGVGLCQIGAAAMANWGYSAEEVLRHYFKGVEIKKIY